MGTWGAKLNTPLQSKPRTPGVGLKENIGKAMFDTIC